MANRVAAHQPKQDNACPAHIAFFPIERTLTDFFLFSQHQIFRQLTGTIKFNAPSPVKMYLKPANRPQIKEEQSV